MAYRRIEVPDLVIEIEKKIDELGIADAEAARRLEISPQRLNQWKRGASIQSWTRSFRGASRSSSESPPSKFSPCSASI